LKLGSSKQSKRERSTAEDNAGSFVECGATHTLMIDITSERKGAFKSALENSVKGTQILYHVGEYCAGPHRIDARAAYDAGQVHLSQRKRGSFFFEYIATLVSK
jgi:hypothetical protein